jgi:O-antigen ligase
MPPSYGYRPLFNHFKIITLADILLAYTILAPLILNVFGSYVKLDQNVFRTFLVLHGPALIAGLIYVRAAGLRPFLKNKAAVLLVFFLAFIVIISSLKNWDSGYAKESLKIFLAFCVFGFFLGMTSGMNAQRARLFNLMWMPFILVFLLYGLYLLQLWGYRGYNFTLPGDNPARTATLLLFFSFVGIAHFSITRNYGIKLFLGMLTLSLIFLAFFTNSRSVIAIFVVLLACYTIFQIIQSRHKLDRYALAIFIGVFIACCVLIVVGMKKNYINNRILSVLKLPGQTLDYIFDNDQIVYREIVRLPIWHQAVSEFSENPILGGGFGSEYYNEANHQNYVHPHNILLQFLAETGVVGLGIFLAFVLVVIKKAVDSYRRFEIKNDKLIFILYPLTFAFFLLSSCFHFAIHENYFLWYFAGIITGFNSDEQVAIHLQSTHRS